MMTNITTTWWHGYYLVQSTTCSVRLICIKSEYKRGCILLMSDKIWTLNHHSSHHTSHQTLYLANTYFTMLFSIVSMAAMAFGVSAAAIDTAAAPAPTKPADATLFHITPLDANDPATVTLLESHKELISEKIAVVKEQDLHDYLAANTGADHVVRLDGSDVFIDLSTVFVATNETEGVDKRQYTSPPFGYTSWKVSGNDQWWDSWRPASGCVLTGNAPSGADMNLGWSYTKSLSTSLS